MKNDKVCISTKVGYLSLALIIMTAAVLLVSQLANQQTSTSSRASGLRAPALMYGFCNSNIDKTETGYDAVNDSCVLGTERSLGDTSAYDIRSGMECYSFGTMKNCRRVGNVSVLGDAYCQRSNVSGVCVKAGDIIPSTKVANSTKKCAEVNSDNNLVEGTCYFAPIVTAIPTNTPIPTATPTPSPTPYEGAKDSDCGFNHINCSQIQTNSDPINYNFKYLTNYNLSKPSVVNYAQLKCARVSINYFKNPETRNECVFHFSNFTPDSTCTGEQYALRNDGSCYTTSTSKGKNVTIITAKDGSQIKYCTVEVWAPTNGNKYGCGNANLSH